MTTPPKRLKRPIKPPPYQAANAADRVEKADQARKPRALATVTQPLPPPVSIDVWRAQARSDYVMDPEQRSALWHYQRTDRPYTTTWAEATFRSFSISEHWTELRERFWREVEERVWNQQREKAVAQKLAQLDELTGVYTVMMEWLRPLRDETGEVKRYPVDHEAFPNLPRFALEMPSIEKYAASMLKMQQQLMLLRGEATSRNETVGGQGDGSISSFDPVGAAQSFSTAELRSIARLLVRNRQPELLDQPEIDIAADGRPEIRGDDDGK